MKRTQLPEYNTWQAMKHRCLYPKYHAYARYGGRGITIHPDWVNSFAKFYCCVGPKPSPKHSLDRIDTNKGYAPDNVRWASKEEQMYNMANNIWITYQGETKSIVAWANLYALKEKTLRYRLRAGWPIELALTAPLKTQFHPIVGRRGGRVHTLQGTSAL